MYDNIKFTSEHVKSISRVTVPNPFLKLILCLFLKWMRWNIFCNMTSTLTIPKLEANFNYFRFLRSVYQVKFYQECVLDPSIISWKSKPYTQSLLSIRFQIGGNWLEHVIGIGDRVPDWTNPVLTIDFWGQMIPFAIRVILKGRVVNFNKAT